MTTSGIVGREAELHDLDDFLGDAVQTPSALVLEGIAGIGKTILWSYGVTAGRQQGHLVLAARPGQPETALSYSALGDLLSSETDEVVASLPGPQRRALEVALLRADPGPRPPDQRTVGVALGAVLRALSRDRPVLLAVDDVQWIDAPTAWVLEYALRRVGMESVKILLSERRERPGDPPLGLNRVLPQDRLRQLEVASLSLAAIQHILATHIEVRFSRSTLLRIHETSGGNPFFALELAHGLNRSGANPKAGAPLEIPGDLANLVAARLGALPARTRSVLAAASALGQPRISVLENALGKEAVRNALERARRALVIESQDGDVVRFVHPLLASAAYQAIPASVARGIHRNIADNVTDPEERAKHLALATEGTDEVVAAALEEVARVAWARGAPQSAISLSDLACRLTPPGLIECVHRRTKAAAEYRFIAGDVDPARCLLEPLVESMTAGRERSEALWLLGLVWYRLNDLAASRRNFEQAALEAEGDSALKGRALMAIAACLHWAGDGKGAISLAEQAVRLSEIGGDDLTLSFVLGDAAIMRMSMSRDGLPFDLIDRLFALRRSSPADDKPSPLRAILQGDSPELLRGLALTAIGNLDEARSLFQVAVQEAVDAGRETEIPRRLDPLYVLELWAGNWDLAARYAQQAWDIVRESGQDVSQPAVLTAKAQIAAFRGEVKEARALTAAALEIARRGGTDSLFGPVTGWLTGFLELSRGNPAGAASDLRLFATPYLEEDLLLLPGELVHYLPDAVEALVATGDLAQSEVLLRQFEEDGRWRGTPYAIATGARCWALLLAARGDIGGALDHAHRAVLVQEEVSMPFEQGRTLLVHGKILRRAKQKKASRESLERALSIFEKLGAQLWAEQTKVELTRVGLRPPAPLELTSTERKVAELSASGLTNRQVAEALFISPKTVEWNLAKIYRKLGVVSRGQLASQMATGRSGVEVD